MGTKAVNQIGMDEEILEAPEVEAALEERSKRRNSLRAVQVKYDEAHEKALAAIATLDLAEGAIVRVGRFRVTKEGVPEKQVAFTSKAAVRIRIASDED